MTLKTMVFSFSQLLLSQKDCPIDPIDEDKLTPLHEAVQLKQVNVAKYLVMFQTYFYWLRNLCTFCRHY